ncbi:importin alpha [Anaeramoeba ignava]|uniref:Importin subunit alpha n=1 Tax=Anaeramoeba ignava TaxID=1746090 RepID=A0A9Q0R8W1_ANAIG|nr:importin alpha [Anaeramoeba ignava]
MEKKQEIRKKQFKQKINFQNQQEKRTNSLESLRKAKRDLIISKRRKVSEIKNENFNWKNAQISKEFSKIEKGNINTQRRSLRKMRKMLSTSTPKTIQIFLSFGIIEILQKYINSADFDILLDVLWCITNIASGNTEQTKATLCFVPNLILYLESMNYKIQEQSCWALSNIAAEESLRSNLISNGILPSIIQILQNNQNNSLAFNAAFTLSNINRGDNPPVDLLFKYNISQVAKIHLNSTSSGIITEILWMLSYLTTKQLYFQQLFEYEISEDLVKIFGMGKREYVIPSLRSLSNICCSNNTRHLSLLLGYNSDNQMSLLDSCLKYLTSENLVVKKETTWLVSNILSGTDEQIQSVISFQNAFGETILSSVVNNFLNDGSIEIKRESAYVLMNVWSVPGFFQQHFNSLEEIDATFVIQSFLGLLVLEDAKIHQLVLYFLQNLIENFPQSVNILASFEIFNNIQRYLDENDETVCFLANQLFNEDKLNENERMKEIDIEIDLNLNLN